MTAQIGAFVVPGHRTVQIRATSLHAPTGIGAYAKVVNHIPGVIQGISDSCNVVIGGDFNLTISSGVDAPEVLLKNADLEIQARLRSDFGLINCWQSANPGQQPAQTLRWANRPEVPYHCDAIFFPVSWQSQLRCRRVLSDEKWVALSDHNPVVAEFA